LQDGTVEAESAGVGKGATFTIYLPLKSEYKTSATQRMEKENEIKQSEMAKVRLDGLRVLVVDDEANAREVFTEMLKYYGAEVKTAGSVPDALLVFSEFKPHVLLSDIAMPGEDGYSLIRKIRALPQGKGRNVPAVALTAHAGADDIRQALSQGFQSHVAKPVNSDYLANIIAMVYRDRPPPPE
jgi:CheY-like chemotaxis protein